MEGTKRYNLGRFVEAQNASYETALMEISNGSKDSHWIWYIFPQLKGLGHSYNAQYYGIESLEEAKAYLAHPILGKHLNETTKAMLLHKGKMAEQILGHIDAMKLCSSMTLFDFVCPNDIFAEVLAEFYGGKRCKHTLKILSPRSLDVKPKSIGEALKYIGVEAADFNLENKMFERPKHEPIHGIGHIYRVMVGCALLGEMIKTPRAALLAFCGAYIHDLARSNDGVEPMHGENAAKYHFERYNHLWEKYNLTDEERDFVRDAVTFHSRPSRGQLSNEGYRILAILKDADALDRCRLGDLNPRMLRHDESQLLIKVIENYCNKSIYLNCDIPFEAFIKFIESDANDICKECERRAYCTNYEEDV